MPKKPETGPMKFGDDWRGLFIRGDRAFALSMFLEEIANSASNILPIYMLQLEGLISLLKAANEQTSKDVDVATQQLKSYKECVK